MKCNKVLFLIYYRTSKLLPQQEKGSLTQEHLTTNDHTIRVL